MTLAQIHSNWVSFNLQGYQKQTPIGPQENRVSTKLNYTAANHKTVLSVRMSRFLSGTLRGDQKQTPIPEHNPSCKAQLSTIESSQHLLQHKQLVCKVQHRSTPIPLLQPSCDEKQSTMDSSSCSFRRVLPSRCCGSSNIAHSRRKSEVLLASNSVRNHAAPPSPCPSRRRCTSDSCCPASCMRICRDIRSRHLLDHEKTESQLSSTIHCTHPLTQIGCLNKD